MKNLLTTSFLSLTLLGGILAQENNSNSNNGQVNDQWKINGNTADSNHFIGTKNENSLKFHTYDIERMRITSEGNVGIGIKQPQGKLDVKGNVYIRNGFLNLDYLRDSTLVSSGVLFIDSSGNVTRGGDLKSYVYGTGHNYLGAEIACAENINGNILISSPTWANSPGKLFTTSHCVPDVKVGIGLINPESKLHIQLNDTEFNTHAIIVQKRNGERILQLTENGLLQAREIKVDLVTWSDYVFDTAYPLMPLEEVKSFIEENHHLPNVLSATDMVKNGLNVADASIMLMEKVEELTLYILQLQAKLQAQQTQIYALKENVIKD